MTDVMKKVLTEEETQRLKWETTTYDGPFTIAELRECFERVVAGNIQRGDWKSPINSRVHVPVEQVKYYEKAFHTAVIHFTGTVPTISIHEGDLGLAYFVITAVGYRAGPAGP